MPTTYKAAAHLAFITLKNAYDKIKECFENGYTNLESTVSRETANFEWRETWANAPKTAQEAAREKKVTKKAMKQATKQAKRGKKQRKNEEKEESSKKKTEKAKSGGRCRKERKEN